ncbi:major facilitator family protein [Cyclospora cayetanensis]|uniref:Major facilitator family protein n=1 Tax=Cyclospora cayetanensis TaxID=88456 RepID=A0A1D3CUL6_9EIME|nr:major facilitator family protein [Cyclospora cayetanensis]
MTLPPSGPWSPHLSASPQHFNASYESVGAIDKEEPHRESDISNALQGTKPLFSPPSSSASQTHQFVSCPSPILLGSDSSQKQIATLQEFGAHIAQKTQDGCCRAAEASRSTTPAETDPPASFEALPDTIDFVMKMTPENQAADAATWAETGKLSQDASGDGEVVRENTDVQPQSMSIISSTSDVKEKGHSLLVPCLAVFSSNYNFVVTSIALYIMNQDPMYRQTLESIVGNGTIKMLSYAGAIVGMCVMGYLGDLIGRRLAMVLTLFLVAFGAFSSAVFSWGTALSVTVVLGVFRFILGVGSGGVYPLSAVTAAEGSCSEKVDDRCLRVSWAYSMNVPGISFPYILALLLWWATDQSVEITFRVLLCFGAVPAFLVWLPAWRMQDSKEFVERDFAAKLLHVFVRGSYWRQLLGTGVCWLLYDVTAYGILLVQPEITQMIWGDGSSVFEVIWHNIVLNVIGIPGCYMGILVLRQMGVKWLQFWGFIGLAGSAFLLAATSHALAGHSWAQLVLLAVVNFYINWGASITTFILPSVMFPPSVRSTYSGISAAMGKVGAVAGIYCMKAVLTTWGLAPMMVCAGVPSLIAAVLTFFYAAQGRMSGSGVRDLQE